MELLRKHPHPHIVQYRGCIVKRGRITGIALNRYHQTLERRLEDRERKFDTNSCFQTIFSAIEHLHSLGLAHNDLSPMNIMVDQEDRSFLIDFGSCQPFGADLITIGTPGWMEDYFMTSAKSHDEFSLRKLRNWLVDMPAGRYEKPSYPDIPIEEPTWSSVSLDTMSTSYVYYLISHDYLYLLDSVVVPCRLFIHDPILLYVISLYGSFSSFGRILFRLFSMLQLALDWLGWSIRKC
jgi:serine/threonine protein kinase